MVLGISCYLTYSRFASYLRLSKPEADVTSQSEKWSPPADKHNTSGQFDPLVHGFDGMVLTSLPGDPQPTDDMVLTVANELPSQFPYLQDMNGGRPLGLGENYVFDLPPY